MRYLIDHVMVGGDDGGVISHVQSSIQDSMQWKHSIQQSIKLVILSSSCHFIL